MNRIKDKDVEHLATILQIGQVDLMKLVSFLYALSLFWNLKKTAFIYSSI